MTETVILGITGTRDQPTNPQKNTLRNLIDGYSSDSTLHHGCCTGVDEFMTMITMVRRWNIVAHPPINKAYFSSVAHTNSSIKLQELPYLERNHIIVHEADIIIAAPKYDEEILRSGTWSTIRYARKLERKIMIVWPNGNIQAEGW